MSRKQLILSWIAVVALLAASDYFFLHFLFPRKKAAMMEQLNRNVERHLLEDTAVPGVQAAEATETPATDSFAPALTECLGAGVSDKGPDELMGRLEKDASKKEIQVENWHLKKIDGREERVMLLGADAGSARRELRLFDVDAEGLPVPKTVDPRLAKNPSAQAIEDLKKSGEVIYHQTQETMKFKDGGSAAVERVNGKVHDLQIFMKGKTLSCRERDCQCR